MNDSEQSLARSQAAQLLAEKRWADTTPEERREQLAKVADQRTAEQMGAAKRSDKARCPCGAMTAARAKARGHKCEPVAPAKVKQRMKKN